MTASARRSPSLEAARCREGHRHVLVDAARPTTLDRRPRTETVTSNGVPKKAPLRPRDPAEVIALFRAEIVGAIARREMTRGELAEAIRAIGTSSRVKCVGGHARPSTTTGFTNCSELSATPAKHNCRALNDHR